jgi:hypothetical protein
MLRLVIGRVSSYKACFNYVTCDFVVSMICSLVPALSHCVMQTSHHSYVMRAGEELLTRVVNTES